MIAALFGLSPTVLAILAAVCSPRFGLAALHGQLFYAVGLLLYSPLSLTVNSLWLVPFLACVLFVCGVFMGLLLLRDDLYPQSERWERVFTVALVLINLLLLVFFLHSVFDIICFRLNEALNLPAVRKFTLIFKVGSGALFIWLALCFFKGKRRAGWAAFYAWLGLLLSIYIILMRSADKVTWPMSPQLQHALQLKANMKYYTVAASAEFAGILYLIPPVLAVLCGLAGFFMIKKPGRRGGAAC